MEAAGSPSGGLLLDKPTGLSSARAVSRVKRLLPRGTRIGHTGTLDPLASGLLVLVLGRATRLSRYVTPLSKTYVATARLGAHSDTLDAEGRIEPHPGPIPAADDLRAALPAVTGALQQTPPMASAIKHAGERLYALHRRGETVEREPRPVYVHEISLLHHDPAGPSATFCVTCSAGTYVRTLVADLAAATGSAAYLTALRRTAVGALSVERATTPEALDPTTISSRIIPMLELVRHLPAVEVGEEEGLAVRHGRALGGKGVEGSFRVMSGGELLGVYGGAGGEARAEVVLWG